MPAERQVIRLRVELLEIRPPVWRRIEVRADATFWALHVALQNAMGWTDSHLHDFELPSSDTGEETWIGMPDFEGDDDREIIPEPCMYTEFVATKTISIDLDAYERLRRARLSPDESFSRVIKRARWRDESKTAAGLLAALDEAPLPDPAALERLEEAQRSDRPPENPWRSR